MLDNEISIKELDQTHSGAIVKRHRYTEVKQYFRAECYRNVRLIFEME